MLNTEFGDDFGMYSGDGEYVIWIAETCEGMLIWVGYLYMIMNGCFTPDYSDKGMLYCWNELHGFCDDEVWEMEHFDVVLEELNAFDEENLRDENGEMLEESFLNDCKTVLHRMIDLIQKAKEQKMRVFIASDWCYEDAEQLISKVR